MRTTLRRTMAFGLFLLSTAGLAQQINMRERGRLSSTGHVFVIATQKTQMPEGGDLAERDALIKSVLEVQKSNPKILSQRHFRHGFGGDARDWIVITEYESLTALEEARRIDQSLFEKKWPDRKEREEVFRKIATYFVTHSDEVVLELPDFGWFAESAEGG